MSDKAIVLLSGGIDSATCLYWAKRQEYDIHALTINYYYRWEREIESARLLARDANIDLIEVDMPFVKEAFNVIPVTDSLDSRWPFYIAAKNILFYSVAAHYAEYMQARWIVGGHNSEDMKFYSDATKEYISTLNKLFEQGCMLCNGSAYQIITPLEQLDKIGVIKLAKDLKVPLELTWSCHRRVERHCGVCYGCRSRMEAFKVLEMRDPVEYA